MRIGILGGTFNPIHCGHLVLAESAREALRLNRVLFVPTARPPHKPSRGILPARVRLRLVRLAIRGHPAFEASDLELRRGGVSYTLETVEALRARRPKARLFLLIGEEMLAVRWRGWARLTRLCTVVAARRATGTRGRPPRGIRWLDMPRIDISSSDIRARVRSGRSVRYLVPRPVERDIRRQSLYR